MCLNTTDNVSGIGGLLAEAGRVRSVLAACIGNPGLETLG